MTSITSQKCIYGKFFENKFFESKLFESLSVTQKCLTPKDRIIAVAMEYFHGVKIGVVRIPLETQSWLLKWQQLASRVTAFPPHNVHPVWEVPDSRNVRLLHYSIYFYVNNCVAYQVFRITSKILQRIMLVNQDATVLYITSWTDEN